MPAKKTPYLLGTYPLGYQWVELYLIPDGYGGYFDSPTVKGGLQKLGVGIADPDYGHVLSVMIHEVFESVSCDLMVRYKKSGAFCDTSSDTYHFHMNHNEFSEICSRVGHFIREVQLDLMVAHKKHHTK
jgi:hypothetical protein